MKTELYKLIKAIDIKSISEDDKEELLRLFMVTKNPLIRNQLALIFSDTHYEKAVPYIIKKINHKSTFNNNGTLVYSLDGFNLKKYFISFIKIICKQEYEARLTAYGIVQELIPTISNKVKEKALHILETRRKGLEDTAIDKGENSTLHFVEQTIKLLVVKE